MASLYTQTTLTTTNTFPSFSFCSFFPKKPQISKAGKRNHLLVPRVACKATKVDHNHTSSSKDGQPPQGKFDRRDVLIGLGGLYGTASLYNDRLALASPVSTDITNCGLAHVEGRHHHPKYPPFKLDCCPPKPLSTVIRDFQLPPPENVPMRLRRAAHLADEEYKAQFREAIKRMKALPPDDPRNFEQQANVHCAYCDGAYHQLGYPDHELQIHRNWLFFPFHRYFLYFFEKILGTLIHDPNFALPYWNWDHPRGMKMPDMFVNPRHIDVNPLYDVKRNKKHLPPTLVDFSYHRDLSQTNNEDQIEMNLKIMHRQMVSQAKKAKLFLGSPYRAGDLTDHKKTGAGTIENVPHNNMHLWCGNPERPYWEDMGNFYSAAKDPIFYAHHANVDRMWDIWKTLEGGNREDFKDPDWLNANFIFYDENAQPVRVYVRDCLVSANLGYSYEHMDIPWKNIEYKPTPRRSNPEKVASAIEILGSVEFPVVLDKVIRTVVERNPRTQIADEGMFVINGKGLFDEAENEEKEEVLVIEGIEFEETAAPVKFDVYVNDDVDSPSGPDKTEFAGSFVHVPHFHTHEGTTKKKKTILKLGITQLLKDLEAENDEKLLVTLVPRELERKGLAKTTIGGIKIELLS